MELFSMIEDVKKLPSFDSSIYRKWVSKIFKLFRQVIWVNRKDLGQFVRDNPSFNFFFGDFEKFIMTLLLRVK